LKKTKKKKILVHILSIRRIKKQDPVL